METKNYDVFISCKSEDYVYAEKIYDYLVGNGFNVFMASRELRKLADSEYRRAIALALRSAYHLIVFASKAEFVESEWVYYEWDMFVNAKLKGFKQGNIFTILKDVRVDDISMDLWKYESMTFDNYQETLLSYVETPEHKKRTEDIKEKLRLEEAESRRKKEAEEKRSQLTERLKQFIEEYANQSVILKSKYANKINTLLYELGVTERDCPVCGHKVKLDESYCGSCGWTMTIVDGIPDCPNIPSPNHLTFHRQLYKQLKAVRAMKENDTANARLEQVMNELERAHVEIDRLSQQLRSLKSLPGGQQRVLCKDQSNGQSYSNPVHQKGMYKIIFQASKIEGTAKTELANYLAFISNLKTAEARALVEKSINDTAEFVVWTDEETAKKITDEIISATGGSAIYMQDNTSNFSKGVFGRILKNFFIPPEEDE